MPHPPGSHIPAVGQGLAVIKRVGQGLASDGLQVPLPVWICGQDLASRGRCPKTQDLSSGGVIACGAFPKGKPCQISRVYTCIDVYRPISPLA